MSRLRYCLKNVTRKYFINNVCIIPVSLLPFFSIGGPFKLRGPWTIFHPCRWPASYAKESITYIRWFTVRWSFDYPSLVSAVGSGERPKMQGTSVIPIQGQIQNLRFCDGRNLADIFSCPEFPVARLDTMSEFSEWTANMLSYQAKTVWPQLNVLL